MANDLATSKADYKECLTENSEEISKCKVLKEVYQADLDAYRATHEWLGDKH